MINEFVERPSEGFRGDLVVDFINMLEYQEAGETFYWGVYKCGTRLVHEKDWNMLTRKLYENNSTDLRWFRVTLGETELVKVG
jgi:hypothetical protein